jgi:hypothetical protein
MMEEDDIGILQAVVAEIFPERLIEKADDKNGVYPRSSSCPFERDSCSIAL